MTEAVSVSALRDGSAGVLTPHGAFDLAHAADVKSELGHAARELEGCSRIELDLAELDHIDGAGAVFLARWLDRLEASDVTIQISEGSHPEPARLITLYRQRHGPAPASTSPSQNPLTRLGVAAATLPATAKGTLNDLGQFASAVAKTVRAPRSVDWRSVPALAQQVGADALPITGAANLLVGLIVGLLGVSQLGRFGATSFVPELVVVAHFRELGPLVTAIVVAGRSGAGLASEIGTMKVSEEIDALRTMGFDPYRWLVIPRCLALVLTLPFLVWIGDVLAVLGGMTATVAVTEMTPGIFLTATAQAITPAGFLTGFVKTPFLALAIGLIACAQGLATRGGAAAVGARTTTAVVIAMFAVIVISSVFTLFYAVAGI